MLHLRRIVRGGLGVHVQVRRLAVVEARDSSHIQSILNDNPGKLVVVDWTATWCGPCKMIAPVLEDLSEQHPDVVFLKIDVDEHSKEAVKAGISAMPTFQFVKDQEILEQFAGADSQKLENTVKEFK